MLHAVIVNLQTVFTTGRNSFNLAIKGLEAIERWFFQKEFPVDEITAIMNSIFPILKTYFITSGNVHDHVFVCVKNVHSNS